VQSRKHSAQHRRRPAHARRRGPSRLTVSVAAGTVVVVGGISAGVAVAATLPATSRRPPAAQARPAPVYRSARPHREPQSPAPSASPGSPAAGSTATPQASPSAQPSAAPAATAARPYRIYDSATPADIPPGQVVATYADGPNPDSPAEVTGARRVLWIDINGSDPSASVLDIEPGCATPSQAPGWVSSRLTAQPHAVAILYTMLSEWAQVQAAVATLPSWMQAQIRWWIADPTGVPHIVPGSSATQWYWGPDYDISTALPGF